MLSLKSYSTTSDRIQLSVDPIAYYIWSYCLFNVKIVTLNSGIKIKRRQGQGKYIKTQKESQIQKEKLYLVLQEK